LNEKKNITPIFTFYIGVIITTLANFILINKVNNHSASYPNYLLPKYISEGLQLWGVSSTLIMIGYQFNINKSLPSIAFEIKNKKNLNIIFWVIFVINILILLGFHINLKGGLTGKITGLLNTIGILFFAMLWTKENNKTYRLYALSLVLIETYIALMFSYLRSDLILPTVYLFLGFFIGKGDIKYVFTYRIIPFIAIILLYASVFKVLQSNRSSFITVFTEQNIDDKTNENSGALLDRSANIAQLTNIIDLVKRNGFYNGRASSPLILALIPRVLWPDKPNIAIGQWFALEIGVAYKSDKGLINNSINMTLPGELYLDFGWIGLAVGSLFVGFFISALWQATKFYSYDYNIAGTLFGGYLFILGIGGFAGDLQIILTLLSTYFLFLIIKKVFQANSQKSLKASTRVPQRPK